MIGGLLNFDSLLAYIDDRRRAPDHHEEKRDHKNHFRHGLTAPVHHWLAANLTQ
jgi:hypothetical protein